MSDRKPNVPLWWSALAGVLNAALMVAPVAWLGWWGFLIGCPAVFAAGFTAAGLERHFFGGASVSEEGSEG